MTIGIHEVICSEGKLSMKAFKLFDLFFGTCVGLCIRQREDRTFDAGNVRRILIIRPGGIGDAVLILSFLRSLRQQYADAAIDILCEYRNKDVFTLQKDLSLSVHCYDDLVSFFSIFKKKYDVVIDTEQWHYLSAIFSCFTTASFRVGFATRPLRRKFFNYAIPYSVYCHESKNFQDVFKPLLREAAAFKNIPESFFVGFNDVAWAKKEVPERFIAISLGASIGARRLSEDQIAAIAKICILRGYDVVLLGSQHDVCMGRKIEKRIKDQRLLNFIGRTTLGQAAAIMKSSQIFFAPDSGLAHIASAAGAFIVVFFGPGNKVKWKPLGDKSLAVSLDMPCSPCTSFGYTVTTCKKRYDCMRGFDMDKILETVFQEISNGL